LNIEESSSDSELECMKISDFIIFYITTGSGILLYSTFG